MKLKFFIIVMFIAVASVLAQSKDSKPLFDPSRDSFDDLKSAIELAKEDNKNIILDVGGNWCVWCYRIDAFMHNIKKINSLLEKNYIVVKINYSKENKNEKFLSQYPKIEGYPHFFVLDKNGKLLHSQNTGDLEKDKGYDIGKFIAFLNEWKPIKIK